jgi:hypothetical protein
MDLGRLILKTEMKARKWSGSFKTSTRKTKWSKKKFNFLLASVFLNKELQVLAD